MLYRAGTTELPELKWKTAVTLGKFDGMHKGHRKILQRLRDLASDNYQTVLFTFDVSPAEYLSGKIQRSLMTNEERRQAAEEAGIDVLVEYPFAMAAGMEPEQFVKEVLIDRLHAAWVVAGADFCFGHHRRGNADMLRSLAPIYGYQIEVVPKECHGAREISSTYIREVLRDGDMELVCRLLGAPFSINGKIVQGMRLGRTLGIPTLNMTPSAKKLLPPNGVYASEVLIPGTDYVFPAVTNIGCRPTVSDEGSINIETHLLQYEGDWHEQEICVRLRSFVRPEICFESVRQLQFQMQEDILNVQSYLNVKQR